MFYRFYFMVAALFLLTSFTQGQYSSSSSDYEGEGYSSSSSSSEAPLADIDLYPYWPDYWYPLPGYESPFQGYPPASSSSSSVPANHYVVSVTCIFNPYPYPGFGGDLENTVCFHLPLPVDYQRAQVECNAFCESQGKITGVCVVTEL